MRIAVLQQPRPHGAHRALVRRRQLLQRAPRVERRRAACGPRPRSRARPSSPASAPCAARSAPCARARAPPRTARARRAAADTRYPARTLRRFPDRRRSPATARLPMLVPVPLLSPPLYAFRAYRHERIYSRGDDTQRDRDCLRIPDAHRESVRCAGGDRRRPAEAGQCRPQPDGIRARRRMSPPARFPSATRARATPISARRRSAAAAPSATSSTSREQYVIGPGARPPLRIASRAESGAESARAAAVYEQLTGIDPRLPPKR